MTKYHARRTWSELCQRWYDSKAEAIRGEELRLLELAGEISGLEYQVRFILCQRPRVSITVDFGYKENGQQVYLDVKGMGETREFRVKRIWLKEQRGVEVRIERK